MKLAYREFGKGRPLIILHGLFGQSDNWNTLAKNFANEDLHVFAIDQRNHGLSPHDEEWSYDVMADDLKEFILEHRLQHPILLGHSMGGKTVLFFEKKFPGIASQIIVVDIATRSYPAHHAEVLDALNAVDFNNITTRKEAEAIMSEQIKDFGTRQFLLKNIYWKEDESKKMDWRFNLKTINEKYDQIREAVPFYKGEVDTLVIKGEKSNYISKEDELDFRSRFPNIQIEEVAGAAHWVHAEKPTEFFGIVKKFIKA